MAEAYYLLSSAYIALTMLFFFDMPKWFTLPASVIGILATTTVLYMFVVGVRDRRSKAERERICAVIRVDMIGMVGTTEEFAARVNAPVKATEAALLLLEDRGFASRSQQMRGMVWSIVKQSDRARVSIGLY